jgi:hypothetical protein
MTLREYNNKIILTIDDSKPVNDDTAIERGNSLRLLGEMTNVDKWHECRNVCLNNPDCELYKFDKEQKICKIYRKEPYKEIKDLDFDNCIKFCSKDNDCDFLSHSNDNKCLLYTREEDKSKDKKSKTSMGDLWLDFPVYGINFKKGIKAQSFDECQKKLGTKYFVYYDNAKYCIPKKFFNQSFGNKTVYFNKTPADKYKTLDNIIGLKSENRNSVEKYKTYIIIIFLFLLLIFFYYITKKN